MSFLRPAGSQWRTPQLGKSVVVSSWKGLTRVQRWPKKRGIPKNEKHAKRLEVFRVFQRIIKALHPRETEYEREAIKEHNRTHRGQRGSAAIRFRDWQTQRLYGRGIAFTTPIGIIFYPPAIQRDASLILDWVSMEPGQILQHQGDEWGSIQHGQPGDILTSAGPDQPNFWDTP